MTIKTNEKQCDCGGFIEDNGRDKGGTPRYKCNKCGKIWWNEADL